MPIILAIEPDRRQRDALTAVVRQRVGAELVVADTTERALEAIGNRVPDLVLVPALLAPQDDAALAAALRVIAAATHVRTLTIPVLAAHAEAAPSSGLLSRWRKGRSASPAPDGCDPAVFADQILAYLKESAVERALMVDAVENKLQDNESQYAEEFGRDDVQAGADAYVQAGAQPYVRADEQAYQTDVLQYDQPDVQTDAQPDVPVYTPYAQPDVPPYTQLDVPPYTQPDAVYAQPDVQAYAQPDAVRAQPDVHTYAQPDAAYSHPDVPAYVQADVPTYSQQDLQTYSQPDVQAYEQPDAQLHMPADVRPEVVDAVEGDPYGTARAGSDFLSALRLHQEEDIDLSGELDGLEADESDGTVSGVGHRFSGAVHGEITDLELFDGEPVGVYTMPSVIDEPEIDVAVLAARQAFAEAEAEIEPAFAADAIAGSDFEAEAAVDSEFFAEPFAEAAFAAERFSEPVFDAEAAVDPEFFADSFAAPEFEAERRTAPVHEADAAVAREFEAQTEAGSSEFEDIHPDDAEPEPADAEPWVAAFLSPRGVWPVMEGVPTEPPAPAASAAVEVAVAEARPAAAPHKRPEWSELVASLRKDIERRRVEPPQEKPKPSTPVQVPRRSKKAKPIQDEWGFFDPEQCGFAALLAKLDEITESAEDVEVHQSS